MALKSATKRSSSTRVGKKSGISRPRSSASAATRAHVYNAVKSKSRDASEEPDSEGFYDTIVVRVPILTRVKPPTPEATPVPTPSPRAIAAQLHRQRNRKREAPQSTASETPQFGDVDQLEVPLQKRSRASRASARINVLDSLSSRLTVQQKSSPPIGVDSTSGVQASPANSIRRIRPQHDKPQVHAQSHVNLLAGNSPDPERDLPDDSIMTFPSMDSDTVARSPPTPRSPRNPANQDFLSLSRDTNSSCEVLFLAKPGVAADRETQTSSLSDAACADAEYAGPCTLTDACISDTEDQSRALATPDVGDIKPTNSREEKYQRSRVAPKKSTDKIVKSIRPVAGTNAQDPSNRQRYRLRTGKPQIQYFTPEGEHAVATQTPQRRVKGPAKGAPGILLTDESKYTWPVDKMPIGINLAAEMPWSKNRNLRDVDDEEGWRMPKIFHSVTFQEDWTISSERISSGIEQLNSPLGRQSGNKTPNGPSTNVNNAEESSSSEELLDTIVVAGAPEDMISPPIIPSRTRTPSLSISSSEVASTIGEWPTSPSPSLTPALTWSNPHDQPGLYMLKDENWPARSVTCEDEMSDVIVVDVMDSGKKLGHFVGDDSIDQLGGCDVLLEAAQEMDVARILAGWRN